LGFEEWVCNLKGSFQGYGCNAKFVLIDSFGGALKQLKKYYLICLFLLPKRHKLEIVSAPLKRFELNEFGVVTNT
jgi:hypothetical protein